MSDAEAQWKQRYYDSLEDLERQEKKWAQVENVLRSAVSRLTLLAEPEHEALNRQLEDLRGAIRRGQDSLELRGLLDRISDAIVELDKRRAAARRNALPASEVLLQLLDAVDVPRGVGRRAKALRKDLVKADVKGDPRPLISEFSQLLKETFDFLSQPPAEVDETRRSGLLTTLFSGRGRDDDPAAESEPAAVQPTGRDQPAPSALLLQLIDGLVVPEALNFDGEGFAARARTAARGEQVVALVNDLSASISDLIGGAAPAAALDHSAAVGEALIQLIERLALPEAFEDKVGAIKEELSAQPGEQTIGRSIVQVANVIAEMRVRMESEKRELEEFLKELTLNLDEIDGHLQDSSARQQASLEDGRQLNDAVEAEMQGIEESVNSATELSSLKAQIEGRLVAIKEHMTTFREAEDSRFEHASDEVQRLQGTITQMERETTELRERIKQARRDALLDVLTGLPNRLAYEERLAQELARTQRYGNPLSLLVLDVDHFKRINDTYGHSAGDKVLKVIGEVLAKNVRATDFIARYGGEEFVVLAPETDTQAGLAAADKLRQAVSACEFHYRGERVGITLSCGIAQCAPDEGAQSLFERADRALYRAKSAGRNRCAVAEAH
ncbi:MAG: hypothetical protein AMJ69_03270 [Gammaproteobacteria bacterium SG8_47]|nr:MAG: hypothetical protein AMJ69_03270 [Gammaproteobacteria bacterium SG8_47]